VLEQLEDRIVLDGAIADTQEVQDLGAEIGHPDKLGWTYIDNGWWKEDNGSGWWWERATDWYWNEFTGWWRLNSGGFIYWYHGEHQYWANEVSTNAWFWWDDVSDQTWEPAFTWFADQIDSEWTWVYNDWNGSQYYTDDFHSLYQDHYGGAWWWFDAVNDDDWEPYRTWFLDAFGVQIYNDRNSSEYVWGNNFHYFQQHTSSFVNDAPVILVPGAQTVSEDTDLTIPAIYVYDVDSGNNPLQVSLSVNHGMLTLSGTSGITPISGGTQGTELVFQGTWYQINNALHDILYRPDSNFDSSDTLSIVVNDLGNSGSGGSRSVSESVLISVIPVDDAPYSDPIPDPEMVEEDFGIFNYNVNAYFHDIDSILSYHLGSVTYFGGLALTDLYVNASSGTLTFESAPDSSGSVEVQVVATDGLNKTSRTFTFTVNSVNDAPTSDSIPGISQYEDFGTYNFSVFDHFHDVDSVLSFSLETVTYNGGLVLDGLSIDPGSGTITFTSTENSYGSVTLQVVAGDGEFATSQTFIFTVNSVNDAPELITLSNTSIPENSGVDAIIGLLDVNDLDDFDTHLFTLPAGVEDNDFFDVIGGNLVARADLDHEGGSPYTVHVRATDAGGLFTEQDFTITVTDVEEPPTVVSQTVTMNEDGSLLITVIGHDGDNPDPSLVHFTISDTVDQGQLVCSGPVISDGSGNYTQTFTYTPDHNYFGTDAFTFVFETPGGGVWQGFDTGQDFGQGNEATLSVRLGDMNGDGSLDIVTGNWGQPLNIYLNDGSGVFSSSVSVQDSSAGTRCIQLADMDGDGRLDILAANQGVNKLYLNRGLDGFGLPVFSQFDIGSESDDSWWIEVADVNGDHLLDVATGNYGQTNKLYFNNGVDLAGNVIFSAASILPGGNNNTTGIRFFDFNSDGAPDLVVGNYAWYGDPAKLNKLYLNDGNGVFGDSPIDFPGGDTLAMNFGDLNNDGLLDYINGDIYHSKIAVNLGGGNWTWAQDIGGPAYSAVLGDIDNDGDPDYLVGTSNVLPFWSNPPVEGNYYLLNDGTGVFGSGTYIGTDIDDTRSVQLADVNNDGYLDLIAGNYNQFSKVYINLGERTTSAPGTVTISITSVNDAPEDITLSNAVIAENSGPNAVIGALTVADPDNSDTHLFTLPEGIADNDLFDVIDGNLFARSDLDYEAGAPFTVHVKVTDAGNLFFEKDFIITVTNVVEAPTVESQTVTMNEDGSLVITVVGHDGDNHDVSLIQFDVVSSVSHGTLTKTDLLYDGHGTYSQEFLYVPYADYNGTDSFEFRMTTPDWQGFGPAVSITGDTDDSHSIQLDDLNGDGYADVIVANYSAQYNKIYYNDGYGNFTSAVNVGSDRDYSNNIRAVDLDNDGDLDLVVTNYNYPGAPDKIYYNNGVGGFSPAVSAFTQSIWSSAIDFGDVNGDGYVDAAIGTHHGIDRVYYNNGAGAFTSYVNLDYSEEATAVRFADLNDDGHLDLVVGFSTPYNPSLINKIYFNNGLGGFLPAQTYGDYSPGTRAIAVEDMDGNGTLDIIQVNWGQPNKIFSNDGHGNFVELTVFGSASYNGTSLSVGDINGDGLLDVVVGNYESHNYACLNLGGGVLSSEIPLGPEWGKTQSLVLGDVNNDGSLDLVVAHRSGQTNELYLNQGGLSADGVVTVTIDPVNDVPTSDLISDVTQSEDFGTYGYDVSSHFHDVDSTLSFSLGTTTYSGGLVLDCLSIAPDTGMIAFASAENSYGSVCVEIVAGDGEFTTSQTFTFTVTPVNDAPTTVGQSVTVSQNGTLVITVTGIDADDPDLGDVAFAVTSPVTHGTLSAIGSVIRTSAGHYSQDFLYTPAADYSGSDSFQFAFTSPGPMWQGYGSNANIGIGTNLVQAMQLGDLDGDGDLDIVVGSNMQQIQLYRNAGDGSFVDSGTVGFADDTRSLALGDVNGDGHLDIVAGNAGQTSKVYLNDGLGQFSYSGSLGSVPYGNTAMALGDVDGDSDLDAVVGNFNEPKMVFLNDGNGAFSYFCNIEPNTNPIPTRAISLGDVNGDGFIDVVAGHGGGTTYVYFNDGHGVFTYSGTMGSGVNWTTSIALGDVNNDGWMDVIEGNWNQTNKVYLNDQTGHFSASMNITAHTDATNSIQVGDVNQDGNLDVVVGNWGPPNKIYLNDGTGQFTYYGSPGPTDYYNTNVVQLGDTNNDGFLDIIAGNWDQVGRAYVNQGYGETSVALVQITVG
jgi:hypothetical protein